MCFASVWNLFLNEVFFFGSAAEGTGYREAVGRAAQSLLHICQTQEITVPCPAFHNKMLRT